jgi:ribosomal protein L16 Arg81 hydroxylase
LRNAYLIPPGQKGLATHYDTHDVFVLQIAGTKHWRLFEETVHLPLEGQRMRPRTEPQTDPTEFDLLAGDPLYLPRGFAHDAVAVDSMSLHLTVGVRPIIWAFVILTAVEAAIEQEPRFRESLPLGFAADTGIRRAAESNLPVLLDIL